MLKEDEIYAQPSPSGHFGKYGGRFVAETLTHALDELAELYDELKYDPVLLLPV